MDKVDWSRPIEAVHEDGRVVGASLRQDDGSNHMPMRVELDGYSLWFPKDGVYGIWRIRNVATLAPKYPDALVEEAMKLVRDLAGAEPDQVLTGAVRISQARAIVAELDQNGRQDNPSPASEIAPNHNELPAKVDADWKLASALAMDNTPETFPTDTCGLSFWVLRGVLAGRALADADAGRG